MIGAGFAVMEQAYWMISLVAMKEEGRHQPNIRPKTEFFHP